MTSTSKKGFDLRPVEKLIDSPKILARVAELGGQITRDYHGKDLVMVGVLKGCMVFMADLIRHINLPLEVEFLSAASYTRGTTPNETLEVAGPRPIALKGRHVLVVEGIVETGRTAREIVKQLHAEEPASVEIVTLLDKPGAHRTGTSVRYTGFSIGNEFVVGYGLDNTQKYRNLPFIARVIDVR